VTSFPLLLPKFACVAFFGFFSGLFCVVAVLLSPSTLPNDLSPTFTLICPNPHNCLHQIQHQQRSPQRQTKHHPNHPSAPKSPPAPTPNSRRRPKWPTATTQATNRALARNLAGDAARTSVNDKQPPKPKPATASPPSPWPRLAKATNSNPTPSPANLASDSGTHTPLTSPRCSPLSASSRRHSP
jgi:hypothetical protein